MLRNFKILILLLLVAVVLSLPKNAFAACTREYKLQFKPPSQPGTPSYITTENAVVNLIPGASNPVPAVVVQLLYKNPAGEWVLDKAQKSQVQVSIIPARLITGDTATISLGEALFSAITVDGDNQAGTVYHFEFSTIIPNNPFETSLKLVTGSINLLTVQDRNRFHHISFANFGFIYREGQTRELSATAVLPTIYIVPTSDSGHALTSGTVAVTISATNGRIEQNAVSYTGTSIVTISGIRFIPQDDNAKQTVLSFTGFDGTTTNTISSGVLTVSTFLVRNKFMVFDESTSFFNRENIGKTAVLNIPLPKIVVQVTSSDYSADSSNSGLIVRVHSDQASLVGAEAQVIQGKATFNRLTFVDYAPNSAILTFTAGPQGDLDVAGFDLYSGAVLVSLTAVKAKYMEFDQSSFIQPDVERTIQVSSDATFVIPSIIVVLKDSAYQLDTSLSGSTIVLVPSSTSIEPTSRSDTTIQNGVAVYTNLEFKGGIDGASFTLRITDEADERESITSARITLAGSDSTTAANRRANLLQCIPNGGTCSYSIAFATTAMTLISAQGQTLFATLGEFIPEIHIVLKDVFGDVDSIDSSIVPTLVAYTGDDPLNEQSLVTTGDANIGKWRDKYYVFTCLRFSERPSGLVNLKFAAMTNTSVIYQAINVLETGYVTVAEDTTAVYGLRFAKSSSLILYNNQPTTAVINIALPQIIVEVIDSIYQFDSTANGIVIVATTSTGTLDTDGSTAVVSAGVAIFTTLKFTTIADNPTLTFRAQKTTTAVAGKTVQTGAISITQLPTASSQIAFSTQLSATNNFTEQYQSLTFDTLSEAVIYASVTVRDSSHQFSETFADEISIEVRCDEATLQTSSSITIGGTTGAVYANFTTRFISYNNAYLGAPIFLKYVVESSTNSLLVGKTLVAGPITIRSVSEAGTCTRQISSPQVVAFFSGTVGSFEAQQAAMTSSLSYLMNIEASRLKIQSVTAATGMDLASVTKWAGVRVLIEFDSPTTASVNQKEPAQLANEFVSLRPMCLEPINGFSLRDVYYAADEASCDSSSFNQALNDTRTCLNTGITPSCQCYDEYLFSPVGSACANSAQYSNFFSSLCNNDALECKEAAVLNICMDVIDNSNMAYWWIFGLVGGLVVIAVILFILYKKGYICKSKQSTMHTKIDEQYE